MRKNSMNKIAFIFNDFCVYLYKKIMFLLKILSRILYEIIYICAGFSSVGYIGIMAIEDTKLINFGIKSACHFCQLAVAFGSAITLLRILIAIFSTDVQFVSTMSSLSMPILLLELLYVYYFDLIYFTQEKYKGSYNIITYILSSKIMYIVIIMSYLKNICYLYKYSIKPYIIKQNEWYLNYMKYVDEKLECV